jgi:RNA polymerase sigma-70 factor (ECF subfamily)
VGENGVTDTAIRDLGTLFNVGATGALTDGQLLARFVERREEAVFEAIVGRHGPMVWGVCRRVLRDHHDAEDAVQATFLVLARRSASIARPEQLGNWLYGVAHQTARKARAMRTKRRRREGRVSDVPVPTAMPDDRRDDLAESLDRELSRLPEKYRIPIVLCDLEGRTHQEAATQLGWPIGTVSGRLSRARALLARRLSRPGLMLSAGSLAVLLAREAASAGLPTKSVESTARAASLVGRGMAGAVSAEVAALIAEVWKAMLLGKLKAVAVAVLTVGILSLAGIGLSRRAPAADDPPQTKAARRPTGWRVQFDKARGSRVTLKADGASVVFLADAVAVAPDGATSIRGSLSSMSRESRERIEALARVSESRWSMAEVKVEFYGDDFKALFVSEMALRVAVGEEGLVHVEGRKDKARQEAGEP